MGSGLPRRPLQNAAVRETNPHWMPLSADAGTRCWDSSFAFLAHGQLRPQSRQNRNSSVILQTEAAGMNEARGPTRYKRWPKPEIPLWTYCCLLGFWHQPKKKKNPNMWVYYCCGIQIAEVIPSWITVAQSHVFELNRLPFDAVALHYSKKTKKKKKYLNTLF